MSSIRLWVLLLSTTTFLAGLAGGLLLAGARPPRDEGPFASYETRLVDAFDLDPERGRWLRIALEEYDAEIEALKSRGVASLEDELVQAGKRCNDRIREHIIPPARRAEFDRLEAGLPLSTGALRQ